MVLPPPVARPSPSAIGLARLADHATSACQYWSSVRAMATPEPQLHERLRALLPSAGAESCRVIATFLDIRGFSTFSEKGESFDVASYLSSIYSTILTSYFPDADFFKPTGE